jgi:small subunit ribosomal protein S4
MARVADAKCRLCRREGVLLYLKGARCFTEKCAVRRRETAPGAGASKMRGRLSEYGTRLREKQKLKRIYGLHERGFRRIYDVASRQKGNTGENLLVLLERRLDNVVYSLGFGVSRPAARQLVVHGHVRLNTKRADAPGTLVKPGDTIRVSDNEKSRGLIKGGIQMSRGIRQVPSWLNAADDEMKGDVVSLPKRADVPFDINELFVVEVCSR